MTDSPTTDPRAEKTSQRPGFTLFFVAAWVVAGTAMILRAGGIGSATARALGMFDEVGAEVPVLTQQAWQLCDRIHHEPGTTIAFGILGATLLPLVFGFRGSAARVAYGTLAILALACFLALPYATFGPIETLRASGIYPGPTAR